MDYTYIYFGQFILRDGDDIDPLILEPIDVIIDDDGIVLGGKRIERGVSARLAGRRRAAAVIAETLDGILPQIVLRNRLGARKEIIERSKIFGIDRRLELFFAKIGRYRARSPACRAV